jgi:prepilin-type N-terminal cleavage/methylation domain-containing protein
MNAPVSSVNSPRRLRGFTLIELLACPGVARLVLRSPQGEAGRAKRSGGFTLIELLVVIVIMGLLLGVALPAFNGIGQGMGVQVAAAELRTTMGLARQWAVTHRETVYVVFPHNDAALYTSAPNDQEKALRAYNVFTESEGYLGDWQYLPAGIYFDPLETPTKNVIRNSSNRTWVPGKIWLGTVTNKVDMWALPFSPDGRVRDELTGSGLTALEVYLTEGYMDTNTFALLLRGADPILVGLEVYPLTGRVKFEDYSIP